MARLLDRNFMVRLASGVILLPLVVWILYLGGGILDIALAGAAFVMAYEWYMIIAPRARSWRLIVWAALGVVWILLPIVSIALLRKIDFMAVLFPLLTVIVTDTMAYVGGRLIGGKKLAPSISPGKTWSGFITGILSAGIFSAGFLYYDLGIVYVPAIVAMLIVGLSLGLVSQISDLLESKFKRHFGVKDSGKIIPGHGGLLDRTDSLVLTLPLYLIIVILGVQYAAV